MKSSLRATALIVSALALGASLAGCSAEEKAAFDKACAERPEVCAKLKKDLEGKQPKAVAKEVSREEAPASLQAWITAQSGSEEPASAVLTLSDVTYVAVTGGMQGSGGYRVEVSEAAKQGDAWVIEARLIAPPPDSMVTTALTNPVGLYRLPRLDGAVKVSLSARGGAKALTPTQLPASSGADKGGPVAGTSDKVTVNARWVEGGMVNVTGTAKVPDIHFEVMQENALLAQADAQVKDGQYVANLIVAGGPVKGLKLVVSEPGGPVLATVPLGVPTFDSSIPADEVWSDNFRVKKPAQVSGTQILVEGKARAFEGRFTVEAWAGGKKLASQVVQTSAGAPEYGDFSARLTVPGGVPAGTEIRYVTFSMKDGAATAELTVAVGALKQ